MKYCLEMNYFGESIAIILSIAYYFNGPFQKCQVKEKNLWGCSSLWLHYQIEEKKLLKSQRLEDLKGKDSMHIKA